MATTTATTTATTGPTGTTWVNPGAQERLRILQRTKTVAMVGASPNPSRSSYFVLTYLRADTNFRLYLVNPTLPEGSEILGLPVYPSLDALPEVPDLVDVFRKVDDLPLVADDAIAVGAKTLWFQLGLRHDGAAQRAHDAGLTVVADRCLKIEHARFHGGLHLAGFDTGVISSRRH
jgi:predicted CoA-binding protein